MTDEQVASLGAARVGPARPRGRSPRRPRARRRRAAGAPHRGAGGAGRPLPRPTRTSGRCTPTAAATATSCAASGASYPHPPDLVAHPTTEADVVAVARLVRRRRASPPSPSAAGRRSSAASRPIGLADALRRRRVDRPHRARPGARDRPHQPRPPASRPAPSGPCSRTSCGRTASRSGTSRRASRSRRSAAGSPPAPAATTPPSTRTSTTSWSRCGSSRRPASASRAGCPAAAPARRPTACSSAPRASLGIITEAWMRLQDRPRWKASAGVRFAAFADGVEAVRALSQSALFPTNCRLLDAGEAADLRRRRRRRRRRRAARARLRVGRPPRRRRGSTAASSCARDHGGTVPDGEVRRDRARRIGDAGRERARPARGAARSSGRLHARRARPLRRGRARRSRPRARGTASPSSTPAVTDGGASAAVREVCGAGWVTCRFTHVYPDGCRAVLLGASPPAGAARELEQWAEIKAAASEAILAAGGTITHHHAVGRDHDRWYQPPAPRARRPRAGRGEGGARPRRHPQPRRHLPECAVTMGLPQAPGSDRGVSSRGPPGR